MSKLVKDKNGNPVGVKARLQPSGDVVVYYPAYLKHNAEKAEENRLRRIKLGLEVE